MAVLRVEAKALAGELEAAGKQVRVNAFTAHPGAELAVVILATTQLVDGAHHVRGAVGVMRIEPVAEQRRHFQWKAQQHVTGGTGAGVA